MQLSKEVHRLMKRSVPFIIQAQCSTLRCLHVRLGASEF